MVWLKPKEKLQQYLESMMHPIFHASLRKFRVSFLNRHLRTRMFLFVMGAVCWKIHKPSPRRAILGSRIARNLQLRRLIPLLAFAMVETFLEMWKPFLKLNSCASRSSNLRQPWRILSSYLGTEGIYSASQKHSILWAISDFLTGKNQRPQQQTQSLRSSTVATQWMRLRRSFQHGIFNFHISKRLHQLQCYVGATASGDDSVFTGVLLNQEQKIWA